MSARAHKFKHVNSTNIYININLLTQFGVLLCFKSMPFGCHLNNIGPNSIEYYSSSSFAADLDKIGDIVSEICE